MINLLDNEYFEWMYRIVCDDTSHITYRKLLRNLYDTEFVWSVDMDSNRASYGISLRYRFGYDYGYSREEIDEYFGNMPCSVLEMIIALSIDIEEHIMCDPSIGDRTGQWFWKMIVNLGLGSMYDSRFNEEEVDEIIDIFLKREYEADGRGGLFRIRGCKYDLRKFEIWIQALWFLAGAAVATLVMAIVNVIFVLKDGTLHITKTEDKETYLFEISNLDKLDGKKQIVLKISREEQSML